MFFFYSVHIFCKSIIFYFVFSNKAQQLPFTNYSWTYLIDTGLQVINQSKIFWKWKQAYDYEIKQEIVSPYFLLLLRILKELMSAKVFHVV